MKVEIKKGTPRGTVAAPPSKSCAHRMIICAALASGESLIKNAEMSEDILATLDCVRALGAEVEVDGSAKTVRIRGCGEGLSRRADALPRLCCRESGSTLRFLVPLSLCGGGAVFSGAERLIDRGVGVYEGLLSPRGVDIKTRGNTITVSGRLSPGDHRIPGNVSSQFISGMLFALPLLAGDSTVSVIPPFESRGYVDITVAAQHRFGVSVKRTGEYSFFIPGGQSYRPADVEIEGDWSQAAFFYALDDGRGEVAVTGLDPQSLQGDRVCLDLLSRIRRGYAEADLSDCPDLAPALFAAAAAAGHGARFTGTRRLAIKESRRADVMAEELAKFGVRVSVGEDTVEVAPGGIRAPSVPLCGHNDHRVVMALSALAARTGALIEGAEAIRKSYPGFFDELVSLGLEVKRYDA